MGYIGDKDMFDTIHNPFCTLSSRIAVVALVATNQGTMEIRCKQGYETCSFELQLCVFSLVSCDNSPLGTSCWQKEKMFLFQS